MMDLLKPNEVKLSVLVVMNTCNFRSNSTRITIMIKDYNLIDDNNLA